MGQPSGSLLITLSVGLLICTFISENQGLEKFQVLHTWIFFSVCHLDFFRFNSTYKSSFFLGGDLEKKSRFAGPEIFLRFEASLDFSKP